ncbi:MAG: LacI family DNA-binding transcriptional regulator [Anaerolineae bacterium]
MATIRDVAKRAGVSPITVSRVINNFDYVSEENRRRVHEAIAEMGYVPNTVARSLRSKRTNTLALVLTDVANPFFTTVARGVEDTASKAGYTVILCNTDESEAEQQKYLDVLIQKQVDGVLLVPATSSPESVRFIQKHKTPLVILDRRIGGTDADIVRGDSEGGAYALVKLLLELGHRHIAMLSGPRGVSTAEDRVVGYRRALAEAGIRAESKRISYGAFSRVSGYEMARRAMAVLPQPTAIFAGHNFMGIGTMQALREIEMRVPEDVAVVCFDDLPLDFLTVPFFTMAAQPAYEMGKKATELLLARLADEGPHEPQEIVLPSEIVIRRSSGDPLVTSNLKASVAVKP